MLPDEVLEQLRGAQLPDAPSLPWLYIVIAVLALCAIVVAAVILWRRRRPAKRWNAYLAQARASSDDPVAQVTALAAVLRRYVLSKAPREDVASAHGERWLTLIESSTGQALPPALQRAITVGIYAGRLEHNSTRLFAQAAQWFAEVER